MEGRSHDRQEGAERAGASRSEAHHVPRLTILATVVALAVTAGPAAAFSGSSGATNGNLAASGIIMRDGGICDPIRHMGC